MKTLGMAALVAAGLLSIGLVAPALSASEADLAFDRAKEALDNGDNDGAIAQLDRAVRLEPKRAKLLGLRGVAWLRKGEYAKGSADLKAAIRLNDDDDGRKYPPSAGAPLSAEAIRHGEQQVAEMLSDRPGMAKYGDETDFLRRWAARKFAGEDLGSPIDWDPSPPLHSDAEHIAPGDNENAAILVAAVCDAGPNRGRPRSFEELWAGAIYELHNVTFARHFVRLNNEADEGKVSKRAFVEGILRYELRAAQQTRAFYLQVFLPWAEKKKLPTDPALWFCDWWDAPNDVLRSFADKTSYPWRPYARTHDWATVHRYWRHGEFQKALKLLKQMCGEEGYGDDEGDVHYWMGRCWEQLRKSDEAIKAFGEAIRLDPNHAPAYRARGKLHQKQGDNKKAQVDFAKAKELEDEE